MPALLALDHSGWGDDHWASRSPQLEGSMFDYLNVVYWLVALLCLFGWARFATFVAADVDERLRLPELPWKLGYTGILLVMFLVFVFVPNFWIALAANFVVVASGVGVFWWKRVQLLGPSGHLFSKTLSSISRASGRMEERKNARQVQLHYQFSNGSAMTLPAADDPLAAGLATADQLIIQGLVRRAEGIDHRTSVKPRGATTRFILSMGFRITSRRSRGRRRSRRFRH